MSESFARAAAVYTEDLEHKFAENAVALRAETNEYIRELVLLEGRVDILAEFVLGYKLEPLHHEMIDWQDSCQEGLLLAWRGSAKTTYCNIARCIYEILANPNVRILLATDALDQGKVFLRSIKSHFTHNERFREIFGDWVIGARTWAESEITVNRRTSHAGEPTIMCAGIGTTLPSRHFDIIICDDLVTKDNSQTEGQRKKVHDYFYETLFPTLESPTGRLYVLGTRWHEEDFYAWLQKEDYKNSTLIIGVLDEEDKSRWEEKYPTSRMYRIRKANLAAFELQYMCRSGIGAGGIFTISHFMYCDAYPEAMFEWQGVDLAIGQKAKDDFFAHVTLGIQKTTKNPHLIAYRKLKMPFPRQVDFLAAQHAKHPSVVRVVIEANAFQLALIHQMRETHPNVPVIGKYTIKDKVARAQQLALLFTDRPLRIKRGHHDFLRILCGFPNIVGSKDLFDALEIAMSQGMKGAKKKRKSEPGVIRMGS